MIQLRILILLALASAALSSDYCARIDMGPYTQIGEKFYWIEGKAKVNWFEAAHICRASGGSLASIENSHQMSSISDYLVQKGYTKDDWFWTSGNDLGKEGEFYWLGTGKKFSYSHWSPGQPDNAGGQENCVHLWLVVNGTFFMNDWACNNGAHYICQANELRIVPTIESLGQLCKADCTNIDLRYNSG